MGLAARFASVSCRTIARRRVARPSSVKVGGGKSFLATSPGGVKPGGMGLLKSFFFMNRAVIRKYQGILISRPSIELSKDPARCLKICPDDQLPIGFLRPRPIARRQ